MEHVMVCLVGEQPLPNLLPVSFDRPEHVLLVHSADSLRVSERLERALRGKALVYSLEVRPYDIPIIRSELEAMIDGRGWKRDQVVFNLTGGTKAMAFAAYGVAAARRSPFIYFESDETLHRVYRYRFDREGELIAEGQEDLPALINLDEFLTLHVDRYTTGGFADKFEEVVFRALDGSVGVDEVKHSIHMTGDLEIDLVVRCGNRVGIAEVKSGEAATKKVGVDQLNTAARREFLGIYTRKFLVVDREWQKSATLRELVESSDIKIIELPGYDAQTGQLPERDRERLVRDIREVLGG